MQALREITDDPAFAEGPCWRYRPFRGGEVIVRQDHPSLSMYLIDRGSVQVAARYALDDGQQLQPGLSTLRAGDVFGEFALFEDQPRSATVTGADDGLLIEFDNQALRRYLDANPAAGYAVTRALMSNMIRRLAQANDRIGYLAAWGLTGREPKARFPA